MWPFKSKPETRKLEYGFHGDRFDLTDGEKYQVEMLFNTVKEYAIKDEVVGQFEKMLTARGIANYAEDQRFHFELEKNTEYLNKAAASYIKAYSVHQLPIYCFDIATCFEMLGETKKAKEMFLMFIKKISAYEEDIFDSFGMAERDIEEMKHYAVSRI